MKMSSKINFDEKWEHPPFTVMSKVVKLGQRQQSLKDRRGNQNEGRANV
jgi:hypothetical protein